MAKVKFKLNKAGVRELLNSKEMRERIDREAEMVTGRAGAGYAYRMHSTGQRVAANVYAETWEAKRSNLKNNTLLKSLGAK